MKRYYCQADHAAVRTLLPLFRSVEQNSSACYRFNLGNDVVTIHSVSMTLSRTKNTRHVYSGQVLLERERTQSIRCHETDISKTKEISESQMVRKPNNMRQ